MNALKIFQTPTPAEITLWNSVLQTVTTSVQSAGVLCGGITSAGYTMCSSADLTIAQWNKMEILINPLVEPKTPSNSDYSYVTYYYGYSSLNYPTEYRFYAALSRQGGSGVTISNSDAATAMYTYGFFNMKIWQDLYMGKSDAQIPWEA